MESHQKGDLTEAVVIAELKRRGIPVLLPFGDNQRYDLAVETPHGALQTLQVKTGWLTDGVVEFHTRSQHTNASGNVYKDYDGDVDGFIVYVHELESTHLVYIDEFDSQISLRVDAPDRPDPSIKWAEEYRFDERWPPAPDRVRSVGGRSPAVEPVCERLRRDRIPFVQPEGAEYHVLACDRDGNRHALRACSGSVANGRVRFPVISSSGIDAYCVYCSETDEIYLVPDDSFEDAISLRVEAPDQPDASINWAAEYAFDEQWPP